MAEKSYIRAKEPEHPRVVSPQIFLTLRRRALTDAICLSTKQSADGHLWQTQRALCARANSVLRGVGVLKHTKHAEFQRPCPAFPAYEILSTIMYYKQAIYPLTFLMDDMYYISIVIKIALQTN